jgi:hypothetical protein
VREREVPLTPKLTPSDSIVKISPERRGLSIRVHIVHFSTETFMFALFGFCISTLESGSSLRTDSSEKTRVTVELLRVSIPYHE